MAIDKKKYFKILFLIFGVLLSILTIVSFKISFIVLIGVCATVFTFYNLELSMGLFILLMSITPHGLWNNSYFALASFFYFGVFIIQVINEKRKGFLLKDIKISLLFFIFFSIYSIFIAPDKSDSIRVFSLLLSSILFSIILSQIMICKKIISMLLDLVCISILLTALYGIMQRFIGIEFRADFVDSVVSSSVSGGRLYSTMDNPNNYAEFLTLFIPLAIAHFLNTKDELKKFVIALIIGIGLYVLIYTLSRGAYVTFLVGGFIFLLIVKPKIVPLGILAGIAIIPLLPNFLIDRILTIGKDSSSKYRLLIWEGVLQTLKDHWATGVGIGPNSFKHVFYNYADPLARHAMHSHNIFLQILLDSGIGGLISFIAFIFLFFKDNFTTLVNIKDKYFINIIAASIFGITATLAYGMAEYIWFYPRIMLCFWIVIGFFLGTIKLSKVGEK